MNSAVQPNALRPTPQKYRDEENCRGRLRSRRVMLPIARERSPTVLITLWDSENVLASSVQSRDMDTPPGGEVGRGVPSGALKEAAPEPSR